MDNSYIHSSLQEVNGSLTEEDKHFEGSIRPVCLEEFIGQDHIRERLEVLISAAKNRKEPLGHCLFSGPPGLGKTTLGNILSKAMGSNIVVTSGPVIEKAGDLAGVLTSLQAGDILFIDELHRLNRVVEEYLYPAMEDFSLDLMIDSGANARSVNVKLNPFTLVGATTRLGQISSPLRSRFALTCRVEYYEPEVLNLIVKRTARILGLELDEESSFEVAKRARGTPRIANNLMRWIRDFAQVKHKGKVDRAVVDAALCMLAIDHKGLDEIDKKILEIIIDNYHGGPVGLGTIAVAIGEDPRTIEEVHEPFLIMNGLLKRTPRGREVTAQAYQHLKKTCETR